MSNTVEVKNYCRGCGKELRGTGASGSSVSDPKTKESCKWNHYGGWVCSKQCDFNSSLELERSMPGHGGSQMTLGQSAAQSLNRNWPS